VSRGWAQTYIGAGGWFKHRRGASRDLTPQIREFDNRGGGNQVGAISVRSQVLTLGLGPPLPTRTRKPVFQMSQVLRNSAAGPSIRVANAKKA